MTTVKIDDIDNQVKIEHKEGGLNIKRDLELAQNKKCYWVHLKICANVDE